MKKLTIFFAIGLLFSLAACEGLTDLMNVTFENVEIEEIIDIPLDDLNAPVAKSIALQTNAEEVYFKDSIILNMQAAEENDTATQELADLLEEISSIDIDTLSIEILRSYDGITLPDDFEVKSLTVSFYNADSLIHTENHQNVVPGVLMISSVTDAGLDGISSTLQQNEDLKVVTSGTVVGDQGVEYFALKTRIVADVETTMANTFVLPE